MEVPAKPDWVHKMKDSEVKWVVITYWLVLLALGLWIRRA